MSNLANSHKFKLLLSYIKNNITLMKGELNSLILRKYIKYP